jgi:hypothetical protein
MVILTDVNDSGRFQAEAWTLGQVRGQQLQMTVFDLYSNLGAI